MGAEQSVDLGMIGLGVMGLNLSLNLEDHGYAVAGYDKDPSKLKGLGDHSETRRIDAVDSLEGLIRLLKKPRVVMVLVPAGPPVDAVIRDLLPHLQQGDIIIDGGNSHFSDTNLREKALSEKGLHFLGVGISGGEEGARHGPSIMPGGPRQAYDRVRPMLEAAAAKVDDEPCVTYLGPRSAGHYVKMMHNGIEYALMQLIAEGYDLMKRGLGLNDDELHDVYAGWNEGDLGGYLIEITSNIFCRSDEGTGQRLIDVIRDVANQKGTGMWASQDAMELHQAIPIIDAAVEMRDLSMMLPQRQLASQVLKGPRGRLECDRLEFLNKLGAALYAGFLISYANGMDQLRVASEAYDYGLDLEHVARIWCGGCIIRAKLLGKVRQAYAEQPDLLSLLLSPVISAELNERQDDLREVALVAGRSGLPAPGFMTALAYYDTLRSNWLPDNLIAAQRDYFGAHTYERTDKKGHFHTAWEEGEPLVGARALAGKEARANNEGPGQTAD
ncbi:MAG: NADP-dependent phosphogluconate dehydrogenase [Armatimonadia bacterium]